jgi:branched-chain amino acid transport system ATP-binding protein
MLEAEGIAAAYGDSAALAGVSVTVAEGEVVALLGRNGMGKTTLVRAITGLLPSVGGRLTSGVLRLGGVVCTAAPAHVRAQAGLGLVPEGRMVFPRLNVEENLVATARGPGPWDLAAAYALFPRLAERRRHPAGRLSGGEQQMLAIGRALLTNPRLLLLDEATEGLAPVLRAEIWAALARLKMAGLGILLVDKNIAAVLRLADRALILEKGRVVWQGSAVALAADAAARETHLHA